MPISVASPTRLRGLAPALSAVVRAALGAEGLRPGEIGIVLTTDAELRALNRRWRGIDRATDVLSFSYDETPDGPAGSPRPARVSGDVAVSLDRVAVQARRYRVRPGRELARLVVHGLLHLAGHDHARTAERRTMRRKEALAMRAAARQVARLERVLGSRGGGSGLAITIALLALLAAAFTPEAAQAAGADSTAGPAPRPPAVAGAAADSAVRPAPVLPAAAGADSAARPAPVPPAAAPQHAVPAPPRPRPPSRDPRLLAWTRAAALADSGKIMRIEAELSVKRDSAGAERIGWNTRVASQAKVGRAWMERLARLLATGTYEPNDLCRPDRAPGSGAQKLVVGVRFGSGDRSPTAVLLFPEACALLRQADQVAGQLRFQPVARTVFGLVREALPQDAVIRAMTPPDTAAKPAPSAPPIVVAPPGGDLPAFGDYVHVDELPEAITKVSPDYPADARQGRIEGTVLLQALVGRDGFVKDTRIEYSIPKLDSAAVKAVKQWRFRPARAKGEPVAVWMAVPVRFSLR